MHLSLLCGICLVWSAVFELNAGLMNRFRTLPANVWILAASQSLAMCSIPMMILVGSLLAAKIAPNETLITLPIALMVVGTASSSVPVALCMKRFGRRKGGFVGFGFGLLACSFGYLAASLGSFTLLLGSCFCFGVASAFGQQFRFAALESVENLSDYGPALSAFMTGGLLSAYVGPEIGAMGRDLLPSPHGFAGSFFLLGLVVLMAAFLFSFYKQREIKGEDQPKAARPLRQIVYSKGFFIAAGTAALSYGLMSFVMTATPITMHELCGFSLGETKHVIQSHIVAMFLPSFFAGWLMKRFGASTLMFGGVLAFGMALAVGMAGQDVGHFGVALVLLGIGWNFLFSSGTALLPLSYQHNERYKAQAVNDFTVFSCQAIVALSAGWFLYRFGWRVLLASCVPLLLVALFMSALQFKRERSGLRR